MFPNFLQSDAVSCGPTCLKIISAFYGKDFDINFLKDLTQTNGNGSTMLGLSHAAEKIGLKAVGATVPVSELTPKLEVPLIAHWSNSHFVVVHKISSKWIYVSDPAQGLIKYERNDFFKSWAAEDGNGIALFIKPTADFYNLQSNQSKSSINEFKILIKYLRPYRKELKFVLFTMLFSSVLQMSLPFLTQNIVDVGIANSDMGFIYLVLIAQLTIFIGRTISDIIRAFLILKISSRINITLVTDYFSKLMQLTLAYFDKKITGEIIQRISDTHRVEFFLTGTSISSLFSLLNFVLFSAVLGWYNLQIFLVFLVGTLLYFFWILLFLKKRAVLDQLRFKAGSRSQSQIIELVNGMADIKLNNAEIRKKRQLKEIQRIIYRLNIRSLRLTTAQNAGSSLINELKNIIITILAASLVIKHEISLGVMLSISYIVGQLNSPVLEMVGFSRTAQDAKLSFKRLKEVDSVETESNHDYDFHNPLNGSLKLTNLSFKYAGFNQNYVLENVNLTFPANKITAIVGMSGSGKTTILKLLLKYYVPTEGEIHLDSVDFANIPTANWRELCGAVLQDGYIFSDTIERNISVGNEKIDEHLLNYALRVANLFEFVETLPQKHQTIIGAEGLSLSAGQKQRLLIARAVYREPKFLFFDEPTSFLDNINESIISDNLAKFSVGRTVVIVAHRLKTVKNADQIIVIDKGRVAEVGNHDDLVKNRGAYYDLITSQLAFGD